MKDTIINLGKFVALEEINFSRTIKASSEEMNFMDQVQALFHEALFEVESSEDDIVVYQLFIFIHYCFLFSFSCYFRGHLCEAYGSLRSAIDGALNAALIIHDRSLQVAYLNSTKPFDKVIRHYNNMNDKGVSVHRYIPALITTHQKCSRFSHADLASFVHRIKRSDKSHTDKLIVQYFQYPEKHEERKVNIVNLLRGYLMTLDVFSNFFINEQKSLDQIWQEKIITLIGELESLSDDLKSFLYPSEL